MTELSLFEVDVKNVKKKGRREGDQLGFRALIVQILIRDPLMFLVNFVYLVSYLSYGPSFSQILLT